MEFIDFPALGAGYLFQDVVGNSGLIWKSIDCRPCASILKNCRRI